MPHGFSRRDLLTLLGAAVVPEPLSASGGEFWNTKNPSQWTDAEVQRLIFDSPWAKRFTARVGKPDPTHDPRPWPEYPPIKPTRPPPILPKLPLPTPSYLTGVIRWESAKPVLDALRVPLPQTFLDHHVISVSAPVVQILMHASDNRLDDLKYLSTLEAHAFSLGRATIIEPRAASVPTLWFAFPKKSVRIADGDSATRFETSFNGWIVEAKFDPQQMWYRGAESI